MASYRDRNLNRSLETQMFRQQAADRVGLYDRGSSDQNGDRATVWIGQVSVNVSLASLNLASLRWLLTTHVGVQ
jgi:hypothetical protein